MITNPNKDELRQVFFDTFDKWQNQKPMTSMESILVDIFEKHPEYHFMFKDPEKYKAQEFFPELGDTNPYLHMSLHMALLEQLATNRPAGIRDIYQNLYEKYHGDEHHVQHLMMEQIASEMYAAQQGQSLPDEQKYLHALKSL